MPRVKISFIVPSYNEAARIGAVLEHATRWADEVVVMDKGSTDGTIEICKKFGDKVRVRTIPFSERGHEKLSEIPPGGKRLGLSRHLLGSADAQGDRGLPRDS